MIRRSQGILVSSQICRKRLPFVTSPPEDQERCGFRLGQNEWTRENKPESEGAHCDNPPAVPVEAERGASFLTGSSNECQRYRHRR